MGLVIPTWFYGIDSLLSVLSALIGFHVSFKFFQLHDMTKRKSHRYLHYGFAILSMSLLLAGIVSSYSYLRHLYPSPTEVDVLGLFDGAFSIEDVAMWFYFFSGTVAYIFFLLAYRPETESALLALPVWTVGFKSFHMLSLFLLSYVVFRAFINFKLNRNEKSGLVLLAFFLLWLHHLFLFATRFSGTSYVIAHLLMISAFLSFWRMLRPVPSA